MNLSSLSKDPQVRFNSFPHPQSTIPTCAGTGKSVTGAHIAYVFAKLNKKLGDNRCVLYCGPSNKSVDVVFGKQ